MCAPSRGDNIVLIGFMGAGKTTIAKELGAAGYDRVDLDEEIVRLCGRSIPEIFAAEGEPFFRERETEALRLLLNKRRNVIATGGGVVGREENWALMRQLGPVIYLRVEWPLLKERIAAGEGRPLADSSDWPRVEALWRSRLSLYEQADFTVEADRMPSEVADAILRNLSEGRSPWKN